MTWLLSVSRMVLFSEFVRLCKRVEVTSSINEKINLIASFLTRLPRDAWIPTLLLLSGDPVGAGEGGLGIGFKTIRNALMNVQKPLLPPPKPTISDVYRKLVELSRYRGEGSARMRVAALQGLFSALDDEERTWLMKIIFGELRIGVSEGNLLKSLSQAADLPYEKVRRLYMLHGSLERVVEIINSGEVEEYLNKPTIFIPMRPMLATPAESVEEAFTMAGGGEVAVEVKYDGARIQIHFKDGRVRVFSRRLTEVTNSLPELVDIASSMLRRRVGEYIVEGEVIAYKDGSPLPFQILMRRFKRIKDVEKIMEDIPIKLYLFDALYIDDKLLIDRPYSERVSVLESLFPEELLADKIVTDNVDLAKNFYEKSVKAGHEGIMVKNLSSPYVLGVRGKYWIKVKPAEHIDVVIVGAEWGHGRRRGWLSDYYLAVYEPSEDKYYVIGKTFKGLTDQEFQYMTNRLKNIIVRDEGYRVWVKPQIVVEVAYNEIQKSPKYRSGYALRLARITRIREDKDPRDVATLDEIKNLYLKQVRYSLFK